MAGTGMSGAQALAAVLHRAGVEVVFSLSGNQIMPVYDAFIDHGIRIVHVRQEAAAVFMADAYAQLTGKLGVAMVTAAPGFGNALGPLYTAKMSESPVLFLSGDSPIGHDGNGAFQELPQTAMTAPVVKAALRPASPSAMAEEATTAIALALGGRPGPVHIALAFDVLNARDEAVDLPPVPEPAAMAPSAADIDAVHALLKDAERPLVLTGPLLNATRGGEAISALAERLAVPVVAMESPRGLRDPMLGAFAEELARADAIVLLGKIADFTLNFLNSPAVSAEARIIAVDPDEAMLERATRLGGKRVERTIHADARAAAAMLAESPQLHGRDAWRAAVAEAIGWRGEAPAAQDAIHPRVLCEAVQARIEASTRPILICDGGEFGQWSQAFCQAERRLINGLSGAIGGCLCYAIAAKVADPGADVFVLMGDGTVGFHFAEFETAAREGTPFTAIIGNDSRWNAEYMIQLRDYGEARLIGCELSDDVRYDEAVRGLGGFGAFVTEAGGIKGALEEAARSGLPACVNVKIGGEPAPAFTRSGKVPAGGH